jgi:hypothetical protein
MESNMKKFLMLMLTCLMALGAGLAKASSRTDAMNADINVVEDYDLIFTYPNKVLDYKNTVDFRMGSLTAGTSDDWGGILDGKFEQVGVIGVYLHRPNSDIFGGEYYSDLASNMVLSSLENWWGSDSYNEMIDMAKNIATPNPLFDLFWGKQLGKLGVGVKLNYADSKDNGTDGEDYTALHGNVASDQYVDEARQIGLQVGVGMKDLGPFQEANFAAGYVLGKVQDSYSQVTADHLDDAASGVWVRDNGIYAANVNINLRHDIDANNNVKLYANWTVNNFGLKGIDDYDLINGTTNPRYPDSMSEQERYTMFNLGLGANHTVNDGDGLVSAGVKLTMEKDRESASLFMDGQDVVSQIRTYGDDYFTDVKGQMVYLPVFVSVEAKVKSWLTLRAGASYYLFGTESIQYDTPQASEFGSGSVGGTISFNTGFGLNWKNFVLDGVFDTNALENNIANVQPGRGLLFGGNLATVTEADLKYKF